MLPRLRTWLALSRYSNLPTVWSNCLAGWWLGGGGNYWKLPFLLLGVSLLYTGGMFLNDAFDADVDRQRRSGRPIPAGKISLQLVWRLGFGLLATGIFLLLFCSRVSAGAAIFLALFIVLYNFSHKFFTAAPWLLGACRFWVYVIAGATGAYGLNGWPIFCGLAVMFYLAGTGYVTRRETRHALVPHWPLLLLVVPVALALMMDNGRFESSGIWISLIFLGWTIRCAWRVFSGGQSNARRIVAGLVAGMVLADWLAVGPQIPHLIGTLVFLSLFGGTRLLQQVAPAS